MSDIGSLYQLLFTNQGTTAAAVSIPFRTDTSMSNTSRSSLRTSGSLDGGSAIIQTLNPSITIESADNSISSTDWSDTNDAVLENDIEDLQNSRLWMRIRLESLGSSADWSAQIINNK